jgi:anti-sigma-K factor RskA
MIDERDQELASLYAFDLLEGEELAAFEAALARNPSLQQLVADLRSTAGALAHTAPQTIPPPAVKDRILATLDERARGRTSDVVPFPSRGAWSRLLPWAIAAGFALGTAFFGERYLVARSQNELLSQREALADVALKSARAQLETEQFLAQHTTAEFGRIRGALEQQLAAVQQTETQLRQALAAAQGSQTSLQQQLAETRRKESSLSEQLVAARRDEAAAKAQLVATSEQTKREVDLARLKIATLASMLNNSPQALAVAVWDPAEQKGVLTVDKLPATGADQNYELWVIDSKPVSAGVFAVGADGRAKLAFKPVSAVQSALKFAISREKNDGLGAHAAPAGDVVMLSQ